MANQKEGNEEEDEEDEEEEEKEKKQTILKSNYRIDWTKALNMITEE